MFDLMTQVDHYCERTDFSFLSEPLNFFSNGFFWLAVWLMYRRACRQKGGLPSVAMQGLLILLFLVGLGSGLFHSLATRWSELCDVGSIGLFVVWFLWFWFTGILRLRVGTSLGLFLLVAIVCGSIHWLGRDWPVNGSQGYFGVESILLILGWHQYRRLSGSKTLLAAGLLFLFSLVLRSLDDIMCSNFPWGTHVFWHTLNAMVCFLTMQAMLEEETRAAKDLA